jgi:hypothetical protein
VYHPQQLSGGGYGQVPSIGYYCPDDLAAEVFFSFLLAKNVKNILRKCIIMRNATWRIIYMFFRIFATF